MVGLITQSSNFNTFGSICYCFITLGIQAYASYKAISRYKEAEGRVWPGRGGDSPVAVSSLLGLTILSLLLMPLFSVASFLKIGNLANDGVKLGRDQEKSSKQGDGLKKAEETTFEKLQRMAWYFWKHFCPVAQTIHLIAAFLLLLPEVLLTAVEVKFGYKSADVPWESELDFLYPEDRAMRSYLRSSVNLTLELNTTHYQIPTKSSSSTGGWGDRVSISIAFVHFCIALTSFLIRYASVFWYTNKALTLVFGSQLLAMVLNSIFSFNSFATLYCVSYNKKLYPNVRLSLSSQVDLMLYLVGSTILIVSTITVFEYGSHYFHEKSKIVERHHDTDSYMKQTVIVNSGCQGYVPHSCAMAALVCFAVCKGPIVYDLVQLMRLTNDQLLLSAVICEVCYMVMWVALWFCLTIKQKWQFRLLDYVPLRHLSSLSMTLDGSSVKINRSDRGDSLDSGSLTRIKRSSLTNPPIRYADSTENNTPSEDPCQSDLGTDESDMVDNAAVEVILGLDNRPVDGTSSLRRSRGRKNAGQRVTFNESIDNSRHFSEPAYQGSLPRSNSQSHGMTSAPQDVHMNVTADVHNVTPPPLPVEHLESSQDVIVRRNSGAQDTALSKEYRNSIRNKCGEFYVSSNNLSSSQEELRSTEVPIPAEPLTTLMSSFRDKVRESSIAASNFKERERHMLEHYNNFDEAMPPASSSNLPDQVDADKRKCLAIPNEDVATDRDCHLMDNGVNSSSLTRRKHVGPSSTGSEDSQRNSLTNSTMESSDLSLPPLMEDIQLGRVRRLSGGKADLHSHHHHHNQHNNHPHHLQPQPRPIKTLLGRKPEIGRRDSANYSLTSSSQDNSSNESDHGGPPLCSQNSAAMNTRQS